MSWIAISGEGQSWVCPGLFGAGGVQRDLLMARGSIMMETRISPDGRPQTLLSYERIHPWAASISFRALPGGGIVLVMSQGAEVFHTVLSHKHDARTDVLRVTFSWDSEARFGQIAVERPESDTVVVRDTPPPPPLMFEDVYTLTRRPQLCQLDRDLIFFAVSDQIEPIGPTPLATGQVPVETPSGHRPLKDLQAGDCVTTRHSGMATVLHRVERRVPAMGSFQPVRLRAPYLGLRRDVVVSPQQRLVIGGTDVEYLFGCQAVLVPALSLVNGFAAVLEQGHLTVRYHDLLLPRHEPFIAAGAELESLYIGRLRRKSDNLDRTLLAGLPRNLLPEHARVGLKVLRPFEAITLVEARAA